MKKPNIAARVLLGILLAGQFSWVGVAFAAHSHSTATPTPEVTVTPQPSATPEPTSTPAPSATPEPTATAEPSASPAPTPETGRSDAAGQDGSKSADKADKTDKTKVSYSKTGVDGCVGVVPKWVYDTTTSTWTQADQGSFTCDTTTGYYLSPKYIYDKSNGWYEIVAPNTPLTDSQIAAPNVVHTVLGDLQVGSKDYQVAQALGLLNASNGILTANTGSAAGASAVPVASGNQNWFDFTNLVNVINNLQSNATSGNVDATKNTQAGDVSTGAATVLANLINLLASAWSWSNGSLNFFMQNLFGDQTGNIYLNPTESAQGGGGTLGGSTNVSTDASGTGSSNTVGVGDGTTLGVNTSTGANIVNNVDLAAQSGDASATKNTQVGNVSSGQALAEVNIINLINSFINSGSSFFGILNIFGNLDGNILFPEGFLNGAVASGTDGAAGTTGVNASASGAGSSNQVGVNGGGTTTVNNIVANGVTNNIATNAASGTAAADSNSSVGNVATGSATTTQSLFNLANSSIFGDNAVLVIVNVLGHWVGKIMTLPGTGSTQSALLTGNATVGANASGADSANQVGVTNGTSTTINNASVGSITNNVKVDAQSGDASATKNTAAGNVTTGDAKAASSVANIFNTVLNVKHWFGVLVVNVFGDWFGDVNSGEEAVQDEAKPTLAAAATAAQAAATSTLPKVGLLGLATAGSVASAQTAAAATTAAPVLTAAAQQTQTAAQTAAAAQNRDMTFMFLISAALMLVAGALATWEHRMKRAQR